MKPKKLKSKQQKILDDFKKHPEILESLQAQLIECIVKGEIFDRTKTSCNNETRT